MRIIWYSLTMIISLFIVTGMMINRKEYELAFLFFLVATWGMIAMIWDLYDSRDGAEEEE